MQTEPTKRENTTDAHTACVFVSDARQLMYIVLASLRHSSEHM